MADGYDQFDKQLDYHEGGGSFVMGLLTGTVLGAGLGMLFAPKAGSELRHKITEQANSVASEGYRRASESAGQWAERGREMYHKAEEAVAKGADEAGKYVRDASEDAQKFARDTASSYTSGESSGPSGSGTPGSSGSSFGSSGAGSSENIRGGASGGTGLPRG